MGQASHRTNAANQHKLSRRRLLGVGGLAAGGAVLTACGSDGASVASTGTESADVVIVGAGFSGLMAARELVAAGKSVIVLEANDRVGGRIWTIYPSEGGFIDMGGQWIGPTMKRMIALTQELGIKTFPQYDTGRNILQFNGDVLKYTNSQIVNRTVIPEQIKEPVGGLNEEALNDFFDGLAEVKADSETVPASAPWRAKKAQTWDTQTVHSWGESVLKTPGAKFLLRQVVLGAFAAEPWNLSYLHLLFYVSAAGGLESLEKSAMALRMDGGAMQVATKLADGLGERVRLNTPVRGIDQTGESVLVTTDDQTFQCRQVVVALPPPLAARISYTPALPPSRDQYTQHSAMGSPIKIHAIYPEPFWRSEDYSGMSVADTQVNVTVDNSPPDGSPGIIGAFIEGDATLAVFDQTDDQRQTKILARFVELFGKKAANPQSMYQANWPDQPWSRGAFAGIPSTGTWIGYQDAMRQPVDRIHWAGTESATEWSQYMEGAIQSGQRVAKEVAAAL